VAGAKERCSALELGLRDLLQTVHSRLGAQGLSNGFTGERSRNFPHRLDSRALQKGSGWLRKYAEIKPTSLASVWISKQPSMIYFAPS
jgi:hypothetical protein